MQRPLSSYFKLNLAKTNESQPSIEEVGGKAASVALPSNKDRLVHVQQRTTDDDDDDDDNIMWELHPEFVPCRPCPAISLKVTRWESLSSTCVGGVEREVKQQCTKTQNAYILTDVLDELQSECPSFCVHQIFDRYSMLTTSSREGSDNKVGLLCSIPVVKDRDRFMVNHSALPRKGVSMHSLPWTQVYSPTQANHLIGNSSASSALLQWLKQWKSKCVSVISGCVPKGRNWCSKRQDDDDDPDFLETEEFPLAALVYGPHGVGKTAAVYACAHEIGFKVCEVNAGSLRTKSRLLQRLKEATLSHRVHPFMAKTELFEKPSSDTLILLEEVDVIFHEDHGFLQGVQDIISSTRRPVILTSSVISKVPLSLFSLTTSDPSSDLQINFLTLPFCFPSELELSLHLSLLSLSNGFPLPLHHSSQISQYFHLDIRKALLYMQFMLSWKPVDPMTPLILTPSISSAVKSAGEDYSFPKHSYYPWKELQCTSHRDNVLLCHSNLDLISILNDFQGEVDCLQRYTRRDVLKTCSLRPSLVDQLSDDPFLPCSVGEDIFDTLYRISCTSADYNSTSSNDDRLTAQKKVLDTLFSCHWQLNRNAAIMDGLPLVNLIHDLDNQRRNIKEGRRQSRHYLQPYVTDLDNTLRLFKTK